MGKARLGGDQVGPIDGPRQKGREAQRDHRRRRPPSRVVIAGANVVDFQLLRDTIAAIVVPRPTPSEEHPQHLSLDRGYDNTQVETLLDEEQYTPHIRRKGEEVVPRALRAYPPRRWVVERLLAWSSKCRGIMTRYAKKAVNYLAFIQVACILLWMRRLLELIVLR